MYLNNFENSQNRRFTSSIESYLGSLSFLPDLFPRLNSVLQSYYKQGPAGKSRTYVLIKNSAGDVKNLETHLIENKCPTSSLLIIHIYLF